MSWRSLVGGKLHECFRLDFWIEYFQFQIVSGMTLVVLLKMVSENWMLSNSLRSSGNSLGIPCQRSFGINIHPGADIGVTQQLLHGTQVATALQQMTGKGMTQHMYVYTMLDAGTLCGFFQHFHQCACRVLLAGSIALEQPLDRKSVV